MNSTTPQIENTVQVEATLALAQANIQAAINASHITPAELAAKMKCSKSFVVDMLCGDHQLTIQNMAKALEACGYRINFRLQKIS